MKSQVKRALVAAASHAPPASHPHQVARLILAAARVGARG
jgi:hypothetical protein